MKVLEHATLAASFHAVPLDEWIANLRIVYKDADDCTGDDDTCKCLWHCHGREWKMESVLKSIEEDSIRETNNVINTARIQYAEKKYTIMAGLYRDILETALAAKDAYIKRDHDMLNFLAKELKQIKEDVFTNGQTATK